MPNRILPDFWRYEPEFNRLRVHTREFLFRLVLGMDDYWRCFVGTSPQSPEFLRSTLYPLNLRVRVSDIASYLTEAQAAGVILIRDSDRGWYVEVVERYRYRREDHEEGQPKFGPRISRAPAQPELHLGPVVLPPAQKTRKQPRRETRPTQANRIPVEDGDETDSAREAPIAESPAPAPGNRALLRSGDSGESIESKRKSGAFAAGEWSKPGDDLWRDLCQFLNQGGISSEEMWNNGKLWLSRLESQRRAVAEAVLQAKTLEKEKFAFQNRGAWLANEFENHTKKAG